MTRPRPLLDTPRQDPTAIGESVPLHTRTKVTTVNDRKKMCHLLGVPEAQLVAAEAARLAGIPLAAVMGRSPFPKASGDFKPRDAADGDSLDPALDSRGLDSAVDTVDGHADSAFDDIASMNDPDDRMGRVGRLRSAHKHLTRALELANADAHAARGAKVIFVR